MQVVCSEFLTSAISSRSVIDYRDLDAPEEMPSPSLPIERNLSGRDTSHSLGNEK